MLKSLVVSTLIALISSCTHLLNFYEEEKAKNQSQCTYRGQLKSTPLKEKYYDGLNNIEQYIVKSLTQLFLYPHKVSLNSQVAFLVNYRGRKFFIKSSGNNTAKDNFLGALEEIISFYKLPHKLNYYLSFVQKSLEAKIKVDKDLENFFKNNSSEILNSKVQNKVTKNGNLPLKGESLTRASSHSIRNLRKTLKKQRNFKYRLEKIDNFHCSSALSSNNTFKEENGTFHKFSFLKNKNNYLIGLTQARPQVKRSSRSLNFLSSYVSKIGAELCILNNQEGTIIINGHNTKYGNEVLKGIIDEFKISKNNNFIDFMDIHNRSIKLNHPERALIEIKNIENKKEFKVPTILLQSIGRYELLYLRKKDYRILNDPREELECN